MKSWHFLTVAGSLATAIIFTIVVFYLPGRFPFSPEVVEKSATLFTAITALATLLLAYVAVRTIENSNEQEKQRRRGDLLTRIIEWAIDDATSGIEPVTPVLSEDKEAAKAWPFLDSQEKKLKTFQLLRARSAYISSIAHAVDGGLKSAVDDSTEKLQTKLSPFMNTDDLWKNIKLRSEAWM
jgi:hypothetical protein